MTDLQDFKLTAAQITALGGGYQLRMTWRQHLAEAKSDGDAVGIVEAEARLRIIDEIEDNRK
ncbi:MAG: hypothetical protein ACR2RE_14390 [Geminicoccaceae bacterium]